MQIFKNFLRIILDVQNFWNACLFLYKFLYTYSGNLHGNPHNEK